MDETYWASDYEAYMGLVHLDKATKGKRSWHLGTTKPAYCEARSQVLSHDRQQSEQELDDTARTYPKRSCSLCFYKTRDVTLCQAISYTYCLALTHDPDGGGTQHGSVLLTLNRRITGLGNSPKSLSRG